MPGDIQNYNEHRPPCYGNPLPVLVNPQPRPLDHAERLRVALVLDKFTSVDLNNILCFSCSLPNNIISFSHTAHKYVQQHGVLLSFVFEQYARALYVRNRMLFFPTLLTKTWSDLNIVRPSAPIHRFAFISICHVQEVDDGTVTEETIEGLPSYWTNKKLRKPVTFDQRISCFICWGFQRDQVVHHGATQE